MRRGLAAMVAAIGLAAVLAPPAGAPLTSLSPASATVEPGGGTSTTVRVTASGVTCLSARPSSGALSAEIDTVCNDAPSWTTTVRVSTAPDIEPGSTHSVRITDDKSPESEGRTFTVRIAAAPPPPPPPTSTTAPTSTVPPAPTTVPATTTSVAVTTTTTTTTPVAPTTTLAPPPPGGGFVPVSALLDEGVPDEGLFLPLRSDGYRSCLPLTGPCVDPGSALVLVPARTTEVTWRARTETDRSSPQIELRGLGPLGPVGVAPPDPGAQDFALPILDLTAQGGQLRTLVRGLDENGLLVTPRVGTGVAAPVAEGPQAAPEAETFLASEPFGRPRILTRDDLTEAAPIVPLFSSTQLQVVYALRPDPSWGLNTELVALLGPSGLPYLVRGLDGPPGLYVARPAGLRVPQTGSPEAAGDDEGEADGGGGGGIPAVAYLGGAVALGAAVTAGLALRRRRGGSDAPAQ